MRQTRIQAIVRIRPLLPLERCRQLCVTHVSDEEAEGLPLVVVGKRQFQVDDVFPFTTSTASLYESRVRPLVAAFASEGANGTVLAYGQTGAGKTHTVMSLVPLIVQDLFHLMEPTRLQFSFVEVYGDDIRDLLATADTAARRAVQLVDGTAKGMPFALGASRVTVAALEEVVALFRMGCERRSKGETAMNDASSRSHAVFCIHMGGDMEGAVFTVVDLAGSERQKRTLNVGVRFKESISINSGLLALGNVIRALAERREHIPYRACKLTRLLQGALGGNSTTVFVACVPPNTANVDETVRTLQYSCKAMSVVNTVLPAAAKALQQQQKLIDADDDDDEEANQRPTAREGTLERQVAALKAALLVAQENLEKDEKIFAEKFKVLKRLHRENAALKHRLHAAESNAERRHADPNGRPAETAPAAVVSVAVNTDTISCPTCARRGTRSFAHNETSPESSTAIRAALHEQVSTIASKYEVAHDMVGGLPPSSRSLPSPRLLPVSPSKKLDFSGCSGSSEEVSQLRENNAALHRQLQSMIAQNEQLTRENGSLSKELEEVAQLLHA